eukprot:6803790-Alexandrium_andersonii.AAC.1
MCIRDSVPPDREDQAFSMSHAPPLRVREGPAVPVGMDDHDLVERGDARVVPVDAERPKPFAASRAGSGAAGKEEVPRPVLGPADEDALRGGGTRGTRPSSAG